MSAIQELTFLKACHFSHDTKKGKGKGVGREF